MAEPKPFCTCMAGNSQKCDYCNRQAAAINRGGIWSTAKPPDPSKTWPWSLYESGYAAGRASYWLPIRRFMSRSRIKALRRRYRAWLIRRDINHRLEDYGLDSNAEFIRAVVRPIADEMARLYDLIGPPVYRGQTPYMVEFDEESRRMAAENGTREQWEDAIDAQLEADEEPDTR